MNIKKLLRYLTTRNVATCFHCADRLMDKAKINFAIYHCFPAVVYTCPDCGKQWHKEICSNSSEQSCPS